MTIAELIDALERIAPSDHAEPWDNTGLLVGRREAPLKGPALLTIDLTERVLEEARRRACGGIVAYHPPIFRPLSRLTDDDPKVRTVLGAIESGLAVYSPHTALDAAAGGVTDWLCEMLGEPGATPNSIGDRRALRPAEDPASRGMHKVVTFTPAEGAEPIRNALSSVGAGQIGDYEQCSFNIEGVGTFFGGEGTDPTVGEAGRLETAEEIRLEMVCPARSLPLAVEMVRQFHPYEEPPIDVYPLAPAPRREIGAGRRLTLDQPATPGQLAERLKANLGVDAVKLASATEDRVTRIGLCPGAGAALLDDAIADGCEMFVTGEMKHHEAASAVARGCSVLLAGHTNTERGYLPRLAERLAEGEPRVEALVSETDRTPFRTL